MIELIIAMFLAIAFSAGCSLFEAVLYSVPMRTVESLAQAGKRYGKIFKNLRLNVEKPISAILTLNTIANTAGASIAGSAATAVFGYEWLGYFAAFFTLSILVFSEILPKTAGVVYGKRLIPFVAFSLKGLVWIMAPALWFSGILTRLISRGKVPEGVTAEEIRVMAQLSLRTGGIKSYQEKIIERILTLQNKKVKDVMTPRTVIFSLSEHLTLEEASQNVTKWEHSRFPVYDQDMEDIVGIALTKELFHSLSEGGKELPLTSLIRPAHFVVETATLDKVLTEFLSSHQHLFVVLDEYGGLAGLISLEDILEEILGADIIDESDTVADKRELARQRRKSLISKT